MERSLPDTCDDVFMSSLSPKELVSFGRSSKTHRRRVDAYMKRAFNIEHLLEKYFTKLEVHWLRYLQSRTQMLISGSTALQFFERIEYPNSDLDLYVEHRHKIMIVEWLLQIGYVFKSRRQTTLEEELDITSHYPATQSGQLVDTPSGYFGVGRSGVANVYNFYKYNPERKIQLITCHRSPVQAVLNFHSSCVMNIITHEKAYALYPKATFEERRSLMSQLERPRDDKARSKYVSRGWTMVQRLSETEIKSSSAFRPGQRYVGDSNCWSIPLYPKMDSLPGSQVEANTWALRFDEKGKGSMRFQTFVCWNLRFSYLFADTDVFEYVRPALCSSDEETAAGLDRDILQLLRWRRIFM